MDEGGILEYRFNKRSLIIIIIAMIMVILTGTFAWLSSKTEETPLVLTVGDIKSVQVTVNPYKINSSFAPTSTYTGENYVTVTAINNGTTTGKIELLYRIASIDTLLKQSSDFKYTITKSIDNTNYEEVKSGNFTTYNNNDFIIYSDLIPSNVTYTYRVYIWLKSNGDQSGLSNKIFSADLRANILDSDYEIVEYIESTGEQWINTGYVPNSTTRLYVKASSSGVIDHTGLFGSRASNSSYPFLSYIENSYGGSSYIIRVDIGDKTGSTGVNWSVDVPFIIDVDLPNKRLIVNNTQISRYDNLSYPTSNDIDISIFSVHHGTSNYYPIVSKLYLFKIYDNDVLVRNYIPVYRKTDTKSGLYDLVNNEFKISQGSGDFVLPDDN